EQGLRRKPLLEQGGQVLRREMGFAEKDQDQRVGMLAAEFGDLVGGVAVAGPYLAQIFAGHAIEPVDGCIAVAGGGEQFEKCRPVVSPVKIEANALAQFVFINLASEPLVENVLIAGKNGFQSQHYRALVEFGIAEEQG